MNTEKLRHHIKHLQEVHDNLDQQIRHDFEDYKDDAMVSFLKKKKLHLRDEIESFKRKIDELEGK